MLIGNSAKRTVAQAPVKFTNCYAGCGATVEYRTTPRVICRDCKPSRRREQVNASVAKQRRKRGVPEVKGKIIACSGCSTPIELNRSSRAKYCPDCAKEAARVRARLRVEAASRERGAPKIGGQVVCAHCSETFVRRGARNYLCPPCGAKSVNRTLTEEQREAARQYKRKWSRSPDGKLRMQTYQKQSRTRRKLNPAFSINERMSASVRQSLVSGKQGWGWEALVGYDVHDLMRHLERQFLSGMTWNNRSEWHIDHILPLASFEFETADDPEFKAAWALTNLRPLWALDNIKKNATRTHLI